MADSSREWSVATSSRGDGATGERAVHAGCSTAEFSRPVSITDSSMELHHFIDLPKRDGVFASNDRKFAESVIGESAGRRR